MAGVMSSGTSRRFLSSKYGFSAPIPPGWFVSVEGSTPFYFNFAPDKSPGRGALPRGGAAINIVAQEDLPSRRGRETLLDWLETDADLGTVETVVQHAAEMPHETGIDKAVWSAFDLKRYGPGDQAQHQINVYWQFRGRLFATHLIYLKGDSRSADYEGLVTKIMVGIRPAGQIR